MWRKMDVSRIGQGFWTAAKNDATQFHDLVRHPIDTAKSLYEGFRGLLKMSVDELKQIPKKMFEEYLNTAQKNIAWLDPEGTDKLALLAYSVGYGAGYLSEQILLSTVAGIFKAVVVLPAVANVGGKVATMMSAAKAGQRILGAVGAAGELAAKAQKAKNLAIKSATQFVKEKTGLDELEGLVKQALFYGCP